MQRFYSLSARVGLMAAENIVSKDLSRRAFKKCREILGGIWKTIEENEFQIKPIHGGLSNLLYLCSCGGPLPHSAKKVIEHEPRNVVLRIFGEILNDRDQALKDGVVYALLSERHVAPRLYGVFSNGRLEEYIDSRSLNTDELRNPTLVKEIGYKLGKFHSLDLPLNKEPKWIKYSINKYLDQVLNGVCFNKEEREKMQSWRTFDFEGEVKFILEKISQSSSPPVFCHNDVQEGNILMHSDRVGDQLRFIDFEYSNYNYRGFDIANHFCEWTLNYKLDKPPYFSHRPQDYPSTDEQELFVCSYISGLDPEVFGPLSPEKLKAEILSEVPIFVLTSHLLWALWGIIQEDISETPFGYLEYAISRLEAYSTLKASMFG